MVKREELLAMIDQCLYNSGESYAAVFYTEYKEVVNSSLLEAGEKEDCNRVLSYLLKGSIDHLHVLRALKEATTKDGKTSY